MSRRIVTSATCLAALALLAAAPAALGFGLSGTVTPATANAGANENLRIQIEIADGDLRDLTIHLPPGLVGNPLAAPQCTAEQLGADSCPPASQVGETTSNATIDLSGLPLTVPGSLYNLVPQAGEPARFGIVLRPAVGDKIILQSPARLRQSDFGLDTLLEGLPNTASGLDITITKIDLTLFGKVNGGNGFIRLPTSCATQTVGFDGVSYSDQPASGSTTLTTTNCAALPFSPELEASGIPEGIGKPVVLTTTISQTIEEAGLANAVVTLPNGITGNNNLLGLACPRTSFDAGSCPANTLIGNASATSPLQSQALTGNVFLVEPPTPGLPALGLDLRGPLSLKLIGLLSLDPTTGQAVNTFAGLPDIPISDFTLTFTREPGFVFAGVDLCKSPQLTVDGAFASHAGAQTTVKAPLELSACDSASTARKPSAKVRLTKLGSNSPRLKLKARRGAERLRQVKLRLPKQLGFTKGKGFDRGFAAKADKRKLKGKAVKHSKRALKLKAKGRKGADRFVAEAARGALSASKKAEGRRLRFKVVITDVRGKRTRIKLSARG